MSTAIKVGIFVVGGIVLFCVGLFLIGSKAQLFGHHFTVYAEFADISTIQGGAKVRVRGMDAGQIKAIRVPRNPSDKFRLRLEVDQKFRPIVRQDSVATIQTEGMVGNQFVNIADGTNHSPECSGNCTLHSKEPVSTDALMRKASDIANTMQSTMQDLQHRADTAMQNITDATGHADQLIKGVQPNVLQMTGNANALIAGIRQGHGAAGKLLTDPTVAQNVDNTVANAREASENANGMIADVRKSDLPAVNQAVTNAEQTTQKINQAVGTILAPGNHGESTAVAIRETAHSAQQASTNMADDTEALKHNFLFRGFFTRRGFYNLDVLTPSKYAATRFVTHPRARVWIPAAGLFQTAPDGSQQLTDSGHSILDQDMSEIVPFLPNNPMVVEGYSDSGAPDQEYLASRQRAEVVEQYLESRFHLNAKHVGIMPLADRPPAHTGKRSWDGVCLVLVVSKKQ